MDLEADAELDEEADTDADGDVNGNVAEDDDAIGNRAPVQSNTDLVHDHRGRLLRDNIYGTINQNI